MIEEEIEKGNGGGPPTATGGGGSIMLDLFVTGAVAVSCRVVCCGCFQDTGHQIANCKYNTLIISINVQNIVSIC